jgi:hypothetical protein
MPNIIVRVKMVVVGFFNTKTLIRIRMIPIKNEIQLNLLVLSKLTTAFHVIYPAICP